jgi:hypothetical protein
MSLHPIASACRFCRYYTPEGRRGGQCQHLGVPVRGGWQACSLGVPTFQPLKDNFENILLVPGEVLPLEASLESTRSDASSPNGVPLGKIPAAEPIPA